MMIRFRTSSTADSSVWVRHISGDIAWWNAHRMRAHSRASRHVPEGIGGPPHAGRDDVGSAYLHRSELVGADSGRAAGRAGRPHPGAAVGGGELDDHGRGAAEPGEVDDPRSDLT